MKNLCHKQTHWSNCAVCVCHKLRIGASFESLGLTAIYWEFFCEALMPRSSCRIAKRKRKRRRCIFVETIRNQIEYLCNRRAIKKSKIEMKQWDVQHNAISASSTPIGRETAIWLEVKCKPFQSKSQFLRWATQDHNAKGERENVTRSRSANAANEIVQN